METLNIIDRIAFLNGCFCGPTVAKDFYRSGFISFNFRKDLKGLILMDVCGFSRSKLTYFFNFTVSSSRELVINDDFYRFLEKIEPENKQKILLFISSK